MQQKRLVEKKKNGFMMARAVANRPKKEKDMEKEKAHEKAKEKENAKDNDKAKGKERDKSFGKAKA